MIVIENDDETNAEFIKIRKNIKCVIDGSNTGNSYFNYETNTFIFFVEKYSNIVYEYSEDIFLVYVKYFENLYNMCKKRSCIDNNTSSYYLKNLGSKIISPDKLKKLFYTLFRNPKNTINKENLKYFAFANSGHDIIKCYIEMKKKFSQVETMIFMNCISENPVWELSESLVSIINTYNAFAYNKNLLMYASYIPLNGYIKRYTNKNKKNQAMLSEESKKNILMYSNDIELCNNIIDYINNDYLEFACKSKNIKIIKSVLDAKIIPNNELFEKFINFDSYGSEKIDENSSEKFKIFDVDDNEEVFLYSELDQFNSKKEKNPLLIRKIKKEEYGSTQEIVYLLEKYGITYIKPNYTLAIKHQIFITPFNEEFTDEQFKEEILNFCSEAGYYPHFENDKYPKPDKFCLYRECGKKNNLKLIKQLVDSSVEPDIECLRIVCSLNYNNMNTIKYFIEKKNIPPDIQCIKNNLRIKNNDLKFIDNIDNDNLRKCVESHGTPIIKYLYEKYCNNA
jgi:hypothetical protein